VCVCVCVCVRAFLFGLLFQHINLMNAKSDPAQLVLFTLVFITLCDASLHAHVCLCSRHDFQFIFIDTRVMFMHAI